MLGVDTQYRAVSHDNYYGRKRAQQKNSGFYGGAWSAYPVYSITTIYTCWVGITEFSIRNYTVEWLSCYISKVIQAVQTYKLTERKNKNND